MFFVKNTKKLNVNYKYIETKHWDYHRLLSILNYLLFSSSWPFYWFLNCSWVIVILTKTFSLLYAWLKLKRSLLFYCFAKHFFVPWV
jgi:hypothetical protein